MEIVNVYLNGEFKKKAAVDIDHKGRLTYPGKTGQYLKDPEGKLRALGIEGSDGVRIELMPKKVNPTEPVGDVVKEWVGPTTTGEESDFSTFREYENGFIQESPHY